MHLEHSRHIAVPALFAFTAISDFARFEAEGTGGASFERLNPGPVALGAQWLVRADFRGRLRRFTITLESYEPPTTLLFKTGSEKFTVMVRYTIIPDGDSCTLKLEIDLAARSLAGRLIFQTLQLARARFERYLAESVERSAQQMEAEYRR